MKRAILCPVLCLIILGGCSSSHEERFFRVGRTPDSKRTAPASLPILPGYKKRLYCSTSVPKATVPYFCYAPDFRMACDQSGQSGLFSLYLALDSKVPDRLNLRIERASGVIQESVSLKAGLNEILLPDFVREGDNISVTNVSRNPMLVSSPIFFERLPKAERELIFLLSFDTLAASHMSLYGYPKETTPHITRFARDAVVFSNAYANSTWTVSSHMSLLTSLLEYGHRVRVRKDYWESPPHSFALKSKAVFPLSSAIPTLTERLSRRFITVSFNGGGNVSAEFGFYRGFDFYRSNSRDMHDPLAAEHLFDRCKTHLEKFPFPSVFYFLHTYYVHTPYQPPPEYLSQQDPPPRISTFDFSADLGGMQGIYNPYPPDFVRDVVSLYDAEIQAADTAFGKFLDYLRANDLYDRSTIILLSDHGEEFLEHGSWVHASNLYSTQLWIPLLIKFSHQESRGKYVAAPVSLLDVMPTLLASQGISLPRHVHGRSLLNLIAAQEDKDAAVLATLFVSKPEEYIPGKIALIQNGLKLIFSEPYLPPAHNFFLSPVPPVTSYELFDLFKDREETNNIMDEHRHDPAVERMVQTVAEAIRKIEKSFRQPAESEGHSLSQEIMNQLRTLGYI